MEEHWHVEAQGKTGAELRDSNSNTNLQDILQVSSKNDRWLSINTIIIKKIKHKEDHFPINKHDTIKK